MESEFATEALPMDEEHAIRVIGITHVNLTTNLQMELEQTVNITQHYLLIWCRVIARDSEVELHYNMKDRRDEMIINCIRNVRRVMLVIDVITHSLLTHSDL